MNIYKLIIDGKDGGIDAISLVDYPAVEHDFICFTKEDKRVYHFADEDRHIVTGVVALADTPIYRYDDIRGEYYVVFERDTIVQMVQKFAKDKLWDKVNIMHDDGKFVNGIYMFESYLTNKEKGISPIAFADVPDGSWIVSYKVENMALWNEIKNGNLLNGFSLQGLFQLEKKFNNQNIFNMTKKELLAMHVQLMNFADVQTDKGLLTIDGEMVKGVDVFINDQPAEDGEYLLEDGTVLVIAGGKIEEIKLPEKKEEQEEETKEEPAGSDDASKIAELENKNAELVAENEKLTAKIAELEAIIAEQKCKMSKAVEKLAKEQRELPSRSGKITII